MLLLSIFATLLVGAAVVGMDSSDNSSSDEDAINEDTSQSAQGSGQDDLLDELSTDLEDTSVESDDELASSVSASSEGSDDGSIVGVSQDTEEMTLAAPEAVSGDTIVGDDSDETISGTFGSDSIEGAGGNDSIAAFAGDDIVFGGTGDDIILGGYGVDLVDGGEGNDVVKGGRGNDFIFGVEGDDTLVGGHGDDLISAGTGADFIDGGEGDDYMFAIDSTANADSGVGADTIMGGEGDDRIWGDDGDVLYGGSGVNYFEVSIGIPGAEPVVIKDLDLFHEEDAELRSDLVSFIDADGELLMRAQLLEGGATLEDAPNGQDAHVYFEGELVTIIEGHTREDLLAETNWLGNLSPHLTGRLDGDDSLSGDPDGVVTDDELFGGPGNDTLAGGQGADFLRGNEGNDFLDGTDTDGPDVGPDSLAGGEGDDTLRGDSGDLMAGQSGTDHFEVVVPASDDEAPVTIYGYEAQTEAGLTEMLTLLDAEGNPLSANDVAQNLVIYQSEEGDQAILEYDGRQVALMYGMDAQMLQDQEAWIGNFEPDPEDGLAVTSASVGDTRIAMTLETASATGQVVSEEMFGTNTVYSVNTELGVPNENYVAAVDALDVLHFRFPAGQSDPGEPDGDGETWLNVMRLEENEEGELDLRPEVKAALDAAIAAHNGGVDVKVTMVVPTKIYSVEEYDALYPEMVRFAELMITEYGEAVGAFEIGNEYWGQGETNYGQKADIAARAFAEGMRNLGLEEEDQPSIIVQMGTPNDGSEFHNSIDDRPFGERRDDANQRIIDQLSDEARDAIDGVVEHYYYNKNEDEFTNHSNERNYIDKDYEIWEQNFDKELDLHLTEWNIRTSNLPQNGIRAAGIVAKQFEYMTEMGVDAAHSWPAVHNTNSMLAGSRPDMPILDDEDRVLNSTRGAMFDVMSSELVGTELVHTEFSNYDGRMEVLTYQSEDKVVFQVLSRTDEPVELDLDVSNLVPRFDSVSGVRIGYDQSSDSSDGIYRDRDGNLVESEFAIVDGEHYYFNEHDVRATIEDLEFDSNEIIVRLKPYEVIQVTFDLPDDGSPVADPGVNITGTDAGDLLETGGGNDTISGLGGNDTVNGGDGSDQLFGGLGDDKLEGGRGDDFVQGEEGNDAIYGFGGDDEMKGLDGDDSISGNQGNDTLLGSQGNDLLRGNDGDDTLNGGMQNDTLSGGAGQDTLTGWSGNDLFRFEGDDMMQGDLITDFEVGKDVIEFNYDDIQSLDDLVIQDVSQGVVVYVGDHGGLLVQGSVTAAQLSDPRNFLFLTP